MTPGPEALPFRVAALYRFATLADPHALQAALAAFCCARTIRGTLILAYEGINGTVAGAPEAVSALLARLEAEPGLAGLDVKLSRAARQPFRRLKVKVRPEIVTIGVAGLDPRDGAGAYVEPAEWNALLGDGRTLAIDTRNDFEVALGTFPGALDPRTKSFGDFPAWVAANRALFQNRRLALFCTGGIRCEKATALLRREGFDEVYHLRGGILRYLEEVPAEASLWSGECFVFDERVAVKSGIEPGEAVLCRACRRPVAPAERRSPLYREGVACPGCAGRARDDQERFAERQRQVELAARRGGAPHLKG
jgi:UPF0176 protein